MRGHSKAGSIKSRGRKPAAPKRSGGTKAARPRNPSAGSRGSEIARLARELAEARQEQTATGDVLRIISSFSGELEPVFRALLEKAVKVCDAKFGIMYRCNGKLFEPVAWTGIPRPLIDHLHQRGAFQPPPGTSAEGLSYCDLSCDPYAHGRSMQRREFIKVIADSTAMWPLAARAQQSAMPVIGFLSVDTPEPSSARMKAFHHGLDEAGFVDGRNVSIEYRWARGQADQLQTLAEGHGLDARIRRCQLRASRRTLPQN
jgi:hypothetical protein